MSQLQVNRINDASGGVLAPISSVMRNRLINGAQVIDQRNAGAAVTVDGAATYITDRFQVQDFSDAVLSAQQISDAPAGFINSLRVTVSTADASLGATQGDRINQRIEGFNIADLGWGTANAKTVTLSFWVKSSLTGTFGGSLQNSASNRAYPFTYTINSANTWEYETITIAGDTTGTWLTNNGLGILVNWSLGMGSTYSGTAGAWAAADLLSTTGAVSLVGTAGATFQITGCQLEVGTQATSFEYRQYQQELALCQRYFIKYSNDGSGLAGIGSGLQITTTVSLALINFPVQMRSEPTVAVSDLQVTDRVSYDSDATYQTIRPGYLSAEITFTNASSGAQFRPLVLTVKNNTSGFLSLSSEL
jgi:hypothetical protein